MSTMSVTSKSLSYQVFPRLLELVYRFDTNCQIGP
jgi:hypothetical protein